MQLVSTTFKLVLAVSLVTVLTTATAQENSPYSRYGLGDLFPSGHIINRGMGGLAVAYSDGQSINFMNPAAYADIRVVTFDVGLMVDHRTLKSARPEGSFKSTNFTPSYVHFGLPILAKKGIGAAIGFRPVTRINYSVIDSRRIPADSIENLYEGTGGLNQVYIGLAKRWDNGLSIGFNAGYGFGRKETSTRVNLVNDTVLYSKSNSATTTTFKSFFFDLGVQYRAKLKEVDITDKKLKEAYYLSLGATGTLSRTLKGRQDIVREIYEYDAGGGAVSLDSIYKTTNQWGTIKMPASFTAGFMFIKTVGNTYFTADKWSVGAEYTASNWNKYSFYGQPDLLTKQWQLRIGGQIVPDPLNAKSYWSRVTYRVGFFTGKDYINADGKELKVIGGTVGFGLPVRKQNYSNQFTTIHTAIEFGKRGNAVNNITDGFLRVSLGLSLSDVWFIKRKYD